MKTKDYIYLFLSFLLLLTFGPLLVLNLIDYTGDAFIAIYIQTSIAFPLILVALVAIYDRLSASSKKKDGDSAQSTQKTSEETYLEQTMDESE